LKRYRVLIDTIDEKGLVHKISGVFYRNDLNIISNSEFVDNETDKFFMRSVIEGDIDLDSLKAELKDLLPSGANIRVVEPKNKNIILLATKEFHALGDILVRHEAGELEANILAVISNHKSLEGFVKKFDIPYVAISHEDLSRVEHERLIIEQIKSYGDVDYIVLAKYMRILTPEFVGEFDGKIINIHHSFLPAFIGANPYKQAYERGVKIIGATSHFVNNNLDDGPIIAQEIIRVNHAYNWRDMQQLGRDVEKVVLSKALKLALEDRIFIYANKTVIF
jgi:formyltetrahydrofolate deformylase